MDKQFISVNDSSLESMCGFKVNMDSLEISPVEIDKISLKQFNSNFSYTGGVLKNTQLKIRIEVRIHWAVGQWCIDLWFDEVCTPGGSGNYKILDYTSPFFNLGDVNIHPGNMKINIPELSLKFQSNSLKVSPQKTDPKITAEKMLMNKIKMEETVVPGPLPPLFGSATIPIQNPLEPLDISICNTKINDFTIGVKLPPFQLTDLKMTNMDISKVESGGFEATGSVNKNSGVITVLGFIDLWVSTTVTTTLKTEKMEIRNLDGRINTDSVSMSGMKMNLTVKDIQIKNIELENYDTKEVEIAV